MSWIKGFGVLIVLAVMVSNGMSCAYPRQKEVAPAETAATVKFYHFEDIKVPADLSLDDSRSFIYDSGGLKAGVLYFSGYVDVDSLVSFFTDSMLKDNWRLKSTFRYPKMVLLFEKANKVCLIIIYERTVNTRVEIWVAPSA